MVHGSLSSPRARQLLGRSGHHGHPAAKVAQVAVVACRPGHQVSAVELRSNTAGTSLFYKSVRTTEKI